MKIVHEIIQVHEIIHNIKQELNKGFERSQKMHEVRRYVTENDTIS
jgi:hypothetical protein